MIESLMKIYNWEQFSGLSEKISDKPFIFENQLIALKSFKKFQYDIQIYKNFQKKKPRYLTIIEVVIVYKYIINVL